ncbi:MAG: HEAT repeat domain-containing protein [Calditrichaeota bacterium]|nr:MAG: HEAT repeat domain-containing protein [Calditrichota bacterium]MBL1206984.1 HEAT repeat domain-containing protein [Calditrichota bacterium]NOG46811.1 HEAT repeat domain-containing protein [Calditrichota bacterium]
MGLFEPNVEKLKAKRNSKALIKALESKSTEVQIKAARALGDLYVKTAVDALLVALTDWNDDVQIAAAEALGKIGKEKAIKPLIYALKEKNPRLKKTIIFALGEIGFDAIQPLIELLNESEGKMQEHVINAIIELGESARKSIKLKLFDHKTENRPTLLKVFAKIGDKESIDILLDILNTDPEYDMQKAAAQHLVDLGEAAVPKLLETAMHPDSDLQLMLVILSQIGDKRCREFFIENMQSSNARIRMMCANGLDKSGWRPRKNEIGVWYLIAKQQWPKLVDLGPVSITPLGKVIDDKDDTIRNAALETIARVGQKGSDILIESLNDKHAESRLQAAAALGKLYERNAIPALSKCLSDVDARVRRAAVESLGKIEDEECINPIIMALKDDDANVRKTAIRYVSHFNDPRALELFIPMLGDPVPVVSQEVVKALLIVGSSAFDALVDALETSNTITKRYAATTLGLIKDIRAVPPLIAQLSNNNWVVRRAVVAALGELDDKRALTALLSMLEDGRDEVALAASKALANIGAPAVSGLLSYLIGRKKNQYAILALKDMKSESIKPLLNSLRHDNTQVRSTVVKVLDLIDWKPAKDEQGAAYWIAKQEWDKSVEIGEQAVEPLIDVLTTDEMWHRKAAAENLGKLKDDKAVDYLIQTLSDKYWNVREASMRSLVKMGRKAVEPLINAMLTGNKNAFESITATLANIGDKRAVQPLEYVLKDNRQFVRQAAVKALEKMDAINSNRRCQSCGKPVHKSLNQGDYCPFCNVRLTAKTKDEEVSVA